MLVSYTHRPTAVVTYRPHHAETSLFVAARLGLAVPGNLSVVAFSEHEGHFAGRKLSTLVVPNYELGLRAAEAVARKLATPHTPLPSEPIRPAKVDMDGTLAPARP